MLFFRDDHRAIDTGLANKFVFFAGCVRVINLEVGVPELVR